MRVSSGLSSGAALSFVALAGCTSLLGDFSIGPDGGSSEGGPSDSGSGVDAKTFDSAVSPGDAAKDSGAAEGSPDGSLDGTALDASDAGALTCVLQSSGQHMLATGLSVDKLVVYRTSMTNSIAIVRSNNNLPPNAYEFRSDRPTQAPTVVTLAANSRLIATARTSDTTYVLTADGNGGAYFYPWPDSSGIGMSYVTTMTAAGESYQAGVMVPSGLDMFYAADLRDPTGASGIFVNFLSSVAPPLMPGTQISSQDDTGLGDGERSYALADGSVMLLYFAADGQLHQTHFAVGSTTPMIEWVFSTAVFPFSFQRNGTGVDIALARLIADAGMSYQTITGTVPEGQLFTFDTASFKPVNFSVPTTVQPCLASYPGGLFVLDPAVTGGLDVTIVDPTTAAVTYSLSGASNLLHGDTSIVTCAAAPVTISASLMTFDIIWTENSGGALNLFYAPVSCTR